MFSETGGKVEIFIVTDHSHIVAAIGSGIGEGMYGLCLVRLAEKLRYSYSQIIVTLSQQ